MRIYAVPNPKHCGIYCVRVEQLKILQGVRERKKGVKKREKGKGGRKKGGRKKGGKKWGKKERGKKKGGKRQGKPSLSLPPAPRTILLIPAPHPPSNQINTTLAS